MEALLDKTTILDTIETEYKAFADLLAPLDGWQLTTPGVIGAWSIKDLLAHLTVWQKHLLMLLRETLEGTEPAPLDDHSVSDEMGYWDEQFYAAAKARPLNEVWAAFHATYAQVKQAIEALSEETLKDPRKFAWLDGEALQQIIASETYEHYNDHALAVHVWLADAE
ncbi:MAG TPA: ClbS/DfsB family four-helix bundle protein [Ktedonobacterales bacterium]|jgi:hypothetical protein